MSEGDLALPWYLQRLEDDHLPTSTTLKSGGTTGTGSAKAHTLTERHMELDRHPQPRRATSFPPCPVQSA
jgi:hypothetical protein